MNKDVRTNIKFSPDYNPNNLAKSIKDTINDVKSEEKSVENMKKKLDKGYNPVDKSDFKLNGTHPTLQDNYKAGLEDLKSLRPIAKRYQHSKSLTKPAIKKQQLRQRIANINDLAGYPSQTAKAIKATENLPLGKKEQAKITKRFNNLHSLDAKNLRQKGFASNAQLDEANVIEDIIKKYKVPYPNPNEYDSKPSLKVAQSIMHKPQDEKARLSNTFKFMKDGIHNHKTFSQEHDFLSKYDYESVKSDKQFKKLHKPTFDDKIAMQYRNKMSSYLFQQSEQGLAYNTAKKMLAPENMEQINYQIQHPTHDNSIKSILKSTPKKCLSKHHNVKRSKGIHVNAKEKQKSKQINKQGLKQAKQNDIER